MMTLCFKSDNWKKKSSLWKTKYSNKGTSDIDPGTDISNLNTFMQTNMRKAVKQRDLKIKTTCKQGQLT
ncbi:hypothetical protein BCR42DRAFT_405458, partial [Absidia repens]